MSKERVYKPWASENYIVYKGDELILRGSVKDICSRLDITPSCVCRAVKDNNLVRRKYRIYYDEDDDE